MQHMPDTCTHRSAHIRSDIGPNRDTFCVTNRCTVCVADSRTNSNPHRQPDWISNRGANRYANRHTQCWAKCVANSVTLGESHFSPFRGANRNTDCSADCFPNQFTFWCSHSIALGSAYGKTDSITISSPVVGTDCGTNGNSVCIAICGTNGCPFGRTHVVTNTGTHAGTYAWLVPWCDGHRRCLLVGELGLQHRRRRRGVPRHVWHVLSLPRHPRRRFLPQTVFGWGRRVHSFESARCLLPWQVLRVPKHLSVIRTHCNAIEKSYCVPVHGPLACANSNPICKAHCVAHGIPVCCADRSPFRGPFGCTNSNTVGQPNRIAHGSSVFFTDCVSNRGSNSSAIAGSNSVANVITDSWLLSWSSRPALVLECQLRHGKWQAGVPCHVRHVLRVLWQSRPRVLQITCVVRGCVGCVQGNVLELWPRAANSRAVCNALRSSLGVANSRPVCRSVGYAHRSTFGRAVCDANYHSHGCSNGCTICRPNRAAKHTPNHCTHGRAVCFANAQTYCRSNCGTISRSNTGTNSHPECVTVSVTKRSTVGLAKLGTNRCSN
jgi:hypothetical protein